VAFELQQENRAAGTAAINEPTAMLIRYSDSLLAERQESCEIIKQFSSHLRSQKGTVV
jgi:hypothetical protein